MKNKSNKKVQTINLTTINQYYEIVILKKKSLLTLFLISNIAAMKEFTAANED